MRRIATAVGIIGALALIGALIGQGVALAQGHHHHHGHHLRAHARAHHKRGRARFERIGQPTSGGGSTEKTEKAEESAGKVVSFEKGVLTIMLNDGSTVTGSVTSETRIKCESLTAEMSDFGGQGEREDGGSDDDNQGMGGMQERCGESALKPEAMVGEALINISPAGKTFVEIELLVQPSTTEKPATEKSNFGDDEFGRQGEFGQEGDH
jgi:hypothetical protein